MQFVEPNNLVISCTMTKLNIHLYGNLFKETCEKKRIKLLHQ